MSGARRRAAHAARRGSPVRGRRRGPALVEWERCRGKAERAPWVPERDQGLTSERLSPGRGLPTRIAGSDLLLTREDSGRGPGVTGGHPRTDLGSLGRVSEKDLVQTKTRVRLAGTPDKDPG